MERRSRAEKAKMVLAFLAENPLQTREQIVEATGIDLRSVGVLIREDLSLVETPFDSTKRKPLRYSLPMAPPRN